MLYSPSQGGKYTKLAQEERGGGEQAGGAPRAGPRALSSWFARATESLSPRGLKRGELVSSPHGMKICIVFVTLIVLITIVLGSASSSPSSSLLQPSGEEDVEEEEKERKDVILAGGRTRHHDKPTEKHEREPVSHRDQKKKKRQPPPPREETAEEFDDDDDETSSSTSNAEPPPQKKKPPMMTKLSFKPATIVSAFFSLTAIGATAKHSHSEYVTWASEFLLTPSPIIIFTNQPNLFRKLRPRELSGPDKMRIVGMNFTDIPNVRRYLLPRIKEIFDLDKIRHGHTISPELDVLWYSKVSFVKMAIEMDPFGSDKYVWTDVGSRRPVKNLMPDLETWKTQLFPHPSKYHLIGAGFLPPPEDDPEADGVVDETADKVTMFSVPEFSGENPCNTMNWAESDTQRRIDLSGDQRKAAYSDIAVFPDVDKFAVGGFFGGTKKALLRYEELYRTQLKRYLDAKRRTYRLDDQHHMLALACLYPDLVQVILPHGPRVAHEWFYYLQYFSAEHPANVNEQSSNWKVECVNHPFGAFRETFKVPESYDDPLEFCEKQCLKYKKAEMIDYEIQVTVPVPGTTDERSTTTASTTTVTETRRFMWTGCKSFFVENDVCNLRSCFLNGHNEYMGLKIWGGDDNQNLRMGELVSRPSQDVDRPPPPRKQCRWTNNESKLKQLETNRGAVESCRIHHQRIDETFTGNNRRKMDYCQRACLSFFGDKCVGVEYKGSTANLCVFLRCVNEMPLKSAVAVFRSVPRECTEIPAKPLAAASAHTTSKPSDSATPDVPSSDSSTSEGENDETSDEP